MNALKNPGDGAISEKRAPFAVRAALFAVMAVLALVVVLMDKPWELGLEERLAASRYPKLDQLIKEGFWYAALANLAACAVMFALARHWSRAASPPPAPVGCAFAGSRSARALFLVGIAAAMIAGAVERWPKMDQSFGNDEEYAFRRLILGQFEVDGMDRLVQPELGWMETLFNNRASNNHILFTAFARLSHEFHNWIASDGTPRFSEKAARLPSFLTGMLSIGLVGLLLALAGRPRAGIAAAFLLAFNPWHLRYATEARGYALMICFILLALCALVRAVDTGRRRHWVAYSAAQTLYLLAFPGALHLVIAMNAMAFFALARSIPAREWRSGGWLQRATPFWHLAAANAFSGMAFLQVFSPSIRQLQMFLDQRAATKPMGLSWLRDVWSHLATGMRWERDDPANPLFLSIQTCLEQSPGAAALFVVVMPAALIAGLIRSFSGRPSHSLLVAPTLLAALLAFGHLSLAGKFLYAWYVIYAVVGMTAGAALGVDWIGSINLGEGRRARAIPAVAAVACLCLLVIAYAVQTEYPRQVMREYSRQPIREAVLAAHADGHDPFDLDKRGLITASIGTSAKQKFTYDPRIVPLEMSDGKAIPALAALVGRADAAGFPLRVLICNPDLVRSAAPKTFATLVGDSGEFRVVERIEGLEKMFTYLICEYRPARH